MKPGDKILYRIEGKLMWKRGMIKGFPADGLIEITKRGAEVFDSDGGVFTVSKEICEIKSEKPEEAQLVDVAFPPPEARVDHNA